MTVTTALYRRYRPDSFADVIGQEHVTEPLMTALRKNRVNHAYLFSGPRGCGKTTSARILARCLNCAQGPTDTPCGTCSSCVELARGGSGSLDVIEIDAASHGGVDDARDLRERATYAPVRDRYKIFIIDEAHMVTSAGFNALLKIVEEPPEHIKFIFATTEPDKVIGTIRSRTHHYPFRLVPPEPLMAYLELLCNQENVPVAPGVLSLVIRAGGGSVRDSLSVLDQLMAGAGPNGLDYELAVALLGYTHASLLDDVVEAVAASDAATVFRAVDRVIQTGHDPRRFVEDLLERFRDLIIVQAMPESAQTILRGMPADQIARLKNQAHNLGAAELSRAADVTNTALTEMTGATSPRLHLELLCARILLPSSEQNERGMAARIDRVERRLNYAGNDVGAPAGAGADAATLPAPPAPQPAAVKAPAREARPSAPVPSAGAAEAIVPALDTARPAPAAPAGAGAAASSPVLPAATKAPGGQAPDGQSADGPAAAAPASAGAGSAGDSVPAVGEPRAPLTAPRVSTSDWPVEERAGNRPSSAPTDRSAPSAGSATSNGSAPSDRSAGSGPGFGSTEAQVGPDAAGAPASARGAMQTPGSGRAGGADQTPGSAAPQRPGPAAAAEPQAAPPAGQAEKSPAPAAPAAAAPAAAPGPMGDVEVLRRAWPDVLQTLSKIKRSTWALVEPNAQVAAFDGHSLTLAFTTSGLAGAFGRADHSENLRQAIHKTVGIDCQITASAGGGTQASSDPNPKVPASRVAPATSADVAWGLAPAPAPAPSPAPSPAPTGSDAAHQAGVASGFLPADQQNPVPDANHQQPARPGLGQDDAGRAHGVAPDGVAQAAATAPQAPLSGSGAGLPASGQPAVQVPAQADSAPVPATYAAPAGDYSYSDDDWGPARDEDAPPLDEEPPLDWAPSNRSQSSATPAGSSPSGTPRRGAATKVSSLAGSAPVNTEGANPPGAQLHGQPGAATKAVAPPHDPWTRAVEQAPGIWVVGEESNVGRAAAAAVPEGAPAGPAAPPRYEPATAQVPPSIPVTKAGTSPEPDWGLDPSASAPGAGRFGAEEAGGGNSVADNAREPEYAMASASSAPAAVPSHVAPAPQSSAAAAAEARQSLYQRLSNSPEAEAGRAKAPARAVAAAATYVQDIPSADDETIEESGVFGRAAVERILGGKLIEERSPDGGPITPRY
ncbi:MULTISPECIES: DNA polymerase III subunit gamma and tau [unclassified Arthrobacter]|uniref:DNA polymerase III subunit gamma and tau n=1 Tax=unclassified Arthrobacter TaxID=235627 RepID=UPI001F106AC9|nr:MULTISPECIES: DNA polymerase III subunit gamma and tau [unclassified Arthrobacter]